MFRKSLWGTVNCGEGRRIWRSEDEDDESHDHAKQSRRDARSLAPWDWLVRYVYVEDLEKRCMIRSEVYLVSKYASAKGPSATHAWQHKLHCAHPYPGVSVSCEQEQRAKSLPPTPALLLPLLRDRSGPSPIQADQRTKGDQPHRTASHVPVRPSVSGEYRVVL